MGKIFYIMGRSATGKDHFYSALLAREDLKLSPIIIGTTRPMRQGEQNGREYFFVDEATLAKLRSSGKIIEERLYHTAAGPWYYFTADDGRIDLAASSYLGIGTLESYGRVSRYFGEERVVPILIETEDETLLMRAIRRERKQKEPNYVELCRRFVADAEDFSEEKIQAAGISRRFENNGVFEDCLEEIAACIAEEEKKS